MPNIKGSGLRVNAEHSTYKQTFPGSHKYPYITLFKVYHNWKSVVRRPDKLTPANLGSDTSLSLSLAALWSSGVWSSSSPTSSSLGSPLASLQSLLSSSDVRVMLEPSAVNPKTRVRMKLGEFRSQTSPFSHWNCTFFRKKLPPSTSNWTSCKRIASQKGEISQQRYPYYGKQFAPAQFNPAVRH